MGKMTEKTAMTVVLTVALVMVAIGLYFWYATAYM